jgi:hypothetical protein
MSRPAQKVIGIGRFDSGVSDLGSNKKHLEGFGLPTANLIAGKKQNDSGDKRQNARKDKGRGR